MTETKQKLAEIGAEFRSKIAYPIWEYLSDETVGDQIVLGNAREVNDEVYFDVDGNIKASTNIEAIEAIDERSHAMTFTVPADHPEWLFYAHRAHGELIYESNDGGITVSIKGPCVVVDVGDLENLVVHQVTNAISATGRPGRAAADPDELKNR